MVPHPRRSLLPTQRARHRAVNMDMQFPHRRCRTNEVRLFSYFALTLINPHFVIDLFPPAVRDHHQLRSYSNFKPQITQLGIDLA